MQIKSLFQIAVVVAAVAGAVPGARAQSLTNGSFELTAASAYEFGALNTRLGTWGTDLGATVTAENGVTPLDGSRMLKFLATFFTQSSGLSGDVSQLVTMGPGLLVEGSAFMNRVNTAGADPRMGVLLRAYAGTPADFAAGAPQLLSQNITQLTTDADLATWQPVSTQLLTPAGTTYLGFWLIAFDDLGTGPGNFLGNYADQARITVVPELASAWMAASGLLALIGLARARRRA